MYCVVCFGSVPGCARGRAIRSYTRRLGGGHTASIAHSG